MPEPSVALLPGSTRRASVHRRLAAVFAAGLVERDIAADVIDLDDHPLPIYHGDEEIESGVPVEAVALHDRIAANDGLILLAPEYNGGPTPLQKNAIDWVTRVDRATLRSLLVGVAAASPGGRGGRTVLGVWRTIGEHMGLDLVDTDFSLPHSGDALGPHGEQWQLVADEDRGRLDAWLDAYVARLRDRAGGADPTGRTVSDGAAR